MRGRVKHRIVKAIHDRFRANGIEIPFPQRAVSVTDRSDGERESVDRRGETAEAWAQGDGDRSGDGDGRWVDETAAPAETADTETGKGGDTSPN